MRAKLARSGDFLIPVPRSAERPTRKPFPSGSSVKQIGRCARGRTGIRSRRQPTANPRSDLHHSAVTPFQARAGNRVPKQLRFPHCTTSLIRCTSAFNGCLPTFTGCTGRLNGYGASLNGYRGTLNGGMEGANGWLYRFNGWMASFGGWRGGAGGWRGCFNGFCR